MGNLTAVIEAVVKAKPSGAKGQYVKTASLATTMGPGIRLDLKPTLALVSSSYYSSLTIVLRQRVPI